MRRVTVYGLFVLFTVLVVASSCTKDPMRREQTANSQFQVDFLFENEGCKVYRFSDNGYHRYYTNCTSTTSQISCGKNCTREDNIPTGHGE